MASTVLLYHAVFCVNSLCHLFGRRRYDTAEDSRNNLLVALLTLGEGWHNNHHHYQSSANQGFVWWEIDVSYYLIRLLGAVGLVWDVPRPPPDKLLPAPLTPAAGEGKEKNGPRVLGSLAGDASGPRSQGRGDGYCEGGFHLYTGDNDDGPTERDSL